MGGFANLLHQLEDVLAVQVDLVDEVFFEDFLFVGGVYVRVFFFIFLAVSHTTKGVAVRPIGNAVLIGADLI